MTRILRSVVPVLALLVALVAFAPPSVMAQLSTDSLIRNLMNLGVAHPVSGKMLAGALTDPSSVIGASLQNTDNTLNTVSLDDEMLALRGRGLLINAWGTFAANANTKDIKLKFGGTTICVITDNTGNATDWAFNVVLVEDGVDTQRGNCWATVAGALVAASSVNFTATVDANVTTAIITTGDNNSAAASAATGKGLVVTPIGGERR